MVFSPRSAGWHQLPVLRIARALAFVRILKGCKKLAGG